VAIDDFENSKPVPPMGWLNNEFLRTRRKKRLANHRMLK
jgi:hypothetical protein